MRRPLLLLGVLAGLLGGCSHGDPSKLPGAEMKPFGFVDYPPQNATLKTADSIRGWALCESGIDRVSIFMDRKFLRNAYLKEFRPDVNKAYPKFSASGRSGFLAELDVMAMPPGAHEFVIQAHSKGGLTSDVGVLQLTIKR